MSNSYKSFLQPCCDRYQRHLCAFAKTEADKVIAKKNIHSSCDRSCSAGTINRIKDSKITAPKKTTKSHQNFTHNLTEKVDYCKTCGDVPLRSNKNTFSRTKIPCTVSVSKINHLTSTKKSNNHKSQIQQFYRNENFIQSTHSFNATDNLKKISLNTISEKSANRSLTNTKKSVIETYPDSNEEIGFMDCNINFKNIKEFRDKNYFECHSAKSRVSTKSNDTNLKHRCIYRFHLNERLFPVPFNTDNQNNIRCVECYLPLDKNKNDSKINGMIQAKVKINDELQDMLLMLPVKDYLIVKQRKSEIRNNEDENVYFGIVKLDLNGDSIFNRTLPEDSLALRYQKGYKELSKEEKYSYERVGENDVIII